MNYKNLSAVSTRSFNSCFFVRHFYDKRLKERLKRSSGCKNKEKLDDPMEIIKEIGNISFGFSSKCRQFQVDISKLAKLREKSSDHDISLLPFTVANFED